MHTLYVGGLPPDASTETLRRLFAEFEALKAVRVVSEASTGLCRGFGYVTFADEGTAQEAKDQLDGRLWQSGRLRVALAE